MKFIKPALILMLVFLGIVVGYLAGKALNARRPREYTIQFGDTCSKIAYQHRVSIPRLIKANESLKAENCANIYIGQKLLIPVPDLPPVEQYNKTGTDHCEKMVYKVDREDIYRVALKFDTSIEILEELNQVKVADSHTRHELIVPLCTVTSTP